MKELNRTLMILLTCLMVFLQISFASAQFDWLSYGNGFTPLWQQQYTGSYGRFDYNVTIKSSIEGYNSSVNVQPLVSSMTSNNTPYGQKEYIIFPNGNYLQIYDKNLLLIDEINVGGKIVNQFDITDFDRDGLANDVTGIWNIGGNYKFRAYIYNFSTTTYQLLKEVNLTANSSNQILGLRCGGGNCYYLNVYYHNATHYKANFTIINKTAFYEAELTLSGNDFSIPNANVGTYQDPLSWYDFDKDGDIEWLAWTGHFVVLFEKDGAIEFNKFNYDVDYPYEDIKPFVSQGGAITTCYLWFICFTEPQSVFWRIAILDRNSLTAYKLDGSTLWTNAKTNLQSLAIDDDYDKDYSKYDNEIYAFTHWWGAGADGIANETLGFYIFKGYDGTIIFSNSTILRSQSGFTAFTYGGFTDLPFTIADMNHNGYKDFIASSKYQFPIFSGNNFELLIFDPFLNKIVFQKISSDENYKSTSCVPADVNLDGFLEVVCSKASETIVYSSALVNQNAYITSVIYNPSTIVKVNNSLIITTNAIDPENDLLLYGIKCNNTADWSADQSSPIFSCYYGELGTFTNTVRVRDQYHFGIYDTFSQQIQVTEAGAVCNFNNVCEGNLGETYINCPIDCPCNFNNVCEGNLGETYISCPNDCPYVPSPPAEWQEIDLPTKIVDVENIEQGLLPTIYYGTLSFLSSTLSPMIILIFVIFFVLIILTIGTIIKKIAHKI